MASYWLAQFRAPLRGTPWGGIAPRVGFRHLGSVHQLSQNQNIQGHQQSRAYANMSEGWAFKKVQYTKYRIAKPWTADTQFDDIILAEPSREALAKFTKEAPLFLRFLKLITDVENRPRAFIDFAKRCENGLVVEKDVYITKDELMKCVWENGYTQNEMNAFEFAFPADYKFHYPELAVLFELPEEDCYKYCIRQRAKTPEKLVEIKYEKPKNLLSSYGLCFLGVWFGFSNQVLSNAWFYSKTFPFGAVFYMLASYFYRNIREFFWKEERSLTQSAKNQKEAGEELVYRQMKKYATDARCLEYLSSFKGEVQEQLAKYHLAVVEQMRQRLAERVTNKLTAIQQAERAIEGSLQEVIVRETVESFQRQFATDPKQQDAAIKLAIQSISGDAPTMDPAQAHFVASLRALGSANLENIAAREDGSVLERVAAVFQRREQEFLESFTVSSKEAAEVKQLLKSCKSDDGFDFSKLSETDMKRLDALQESIFSRVGFTTITEDDIKPLEAVSPSNIPLVEQVNTQVRLSQNYTEYNVPCRQLVEMRGTAVRTAFGGLEEVQAGKFCSKAALNYCIILLTSCRETSDGLIPHLADSSYWKKLSFTQFVIYLVGFSEGLTHLAALAIYYMLKDDLGKLLLPLEGCPQLHHVFLTGLNPAEVSALFIAPALPWVFKPIFAFISDSYPLYGSRRKPYMVAFSLLECLGFVMLGTFPTHVCYFLSLFFLQISASFCSAVAEALVVETTAGHSIDQSAENVSDFITAKALGSLIVAYLSGYLLEKTSKQSIFLATSMFPLFIAFITLFMTDVSAAPTQDIKTKLRSLMEFLKQSVIWGPALYIFAYMAGPDYDDALFFYFTNKLGFSPTFMGTLRFTYGIAALVGVVLYRNFFKSTGFRKTLLATILVAVPIYMSPIILTTGLNRMLGIGDKAFVLSGGFLIEAYIKGNSKHDRPRKSNSCHFSCLPLPFAPRVLKAVSIP
ncbi:hypothetical protein Efla_007574 [Eimeria flavescens]